MECRVNIPVAFFGGSPGMGEILLILVVLLLLFGARRLPSIARSLGRTLEQFRRAARDLSRDIVNGNESQDTQKLSSDADTPPPAPEERKG